jgi:hypothetical protein
VLFFWYTKKATSMTSVPRSAPGTTECFIFLELFLGAERYFVSALWLRVFLSLDTSFIVSAVDYYYRKKCTT